MRFPIEIKYLSVTFKDKEKEAAFLNWSYPLQFDLFRKLVYIGVFATIFFALPDYTRLGATKPFFSSLSSRVLFSALVLGLLFAIAKVNKAQFFHFALFALAILIIVNTTVIVIRLGNHSVIYAMSEMIAVMVMYVLLKQRFLYSLFSGTAASFVLAFSHIQYGELDSSSMQAIAYAFLLTNVFGIMYNRNVNISERKEFLNLMYEQDTNARLEKEIQRRVKLEEELITAARTDPLTKLYNRNFFFDMARQELLKCERYNMFMSVIIIDIDYFKQVNDNYGHPVGDEVLEDFAALLKNHTRESDILARFGGEEFILLAPNTLEGDAIVLAEKLRNDISKSPIGETGINITISAGVTQYRKGDSISEMILKADKALYSAKQNGRNQVVAEAAVT